MNYDIKNCITIFILKIFFSKSIFCLCPGESKQYAEDESPVDFLNRASYNYATAIKFKPKDPDLHLQLGMVLEERYYAEDLFGFKKEVSVHDSCNFSLIDY